ncbi:hypothetical protein D9V37_01890 [Nocardioides mangrovicus]|uniref:Uncharacterized protein n=1 Tax=Nocardioides mangrovicus TaxID=2478913 RepID=A0A3L8P6X0_9ACTN|nr:hypothetical protein [Nocardioides mangrovicus]RLV50737.1 hypothetical protein D9V37_01890 [Nocardioides mangrovicus]
MGLKEKLLPALRAGDITAGWEVVHGLHGEERREAKAWFASNQRWVSELDDTEFRPATDPETGEYDRARDEGRWDRFSAAHTILAITAIELCGPVTAAQRLAGGFWDRDEQTAHVVHALWEKDAAWVQDFVTEAAATSGHAEVVRAAVVHHGLPCPSGETFLSSWSSGAPITWNYVDATYTRREPVGEWLDRDPLLPDLMYHLLASDHCGSDEWIADALPIGVERGVFDRDQLLETLLTALTSRHRPGAQKVMAASLQALTLTTAEIPGGLDYLMGVMATTKSAVMKALLPHALTLTTTAEELLDLTLLVSTREKLHKKRLLTELTKGVLADRFNAEALVEALGVLAADPDVRFAADVAAAMERLDAAVTAEPSPSSTGLWALTPTASPRTHPGAWWDRRDPPTLDRTLSREARYDSQEQLDQSIRDLLTSMAEGEDWPAVLLPPLDRLISATGLSLSKTTRAFEDLFLGGGMRQAYLVALWVADRCCELARRPAGLHLFLRMVGQYAIEVPDDVDLALPPHLTALAVAPGRTSAQEEVRRLGAALARVADPDIWLADLRAAQDHPVAAPKMPRGLWQQVVARPLPAETPVKDDRTARADDLVELARCVLDTRQHPLEVHVWCHDPEQVARDRQYVTQTPAAEDEITVLSVVTGIAEHGPDRVRGSLVATSLPSSGHRLTTDRGAVLTWARGVTTPRAYWRLALRSVGSRDVIRRLSRADRDAHRDIEQFAYTTADYPEQLPDDHDWLTRAPVLARLLAADSPLAVATGVEEIDTEPLLVARYLPQAYDTVVYLRVLEAILNAENNDVLLAVPTFADFTLDFDDLLARLRESAGRTVGPLDLVQALHRLRPIDPGRLGELDGLEVRTTPELTTPGGEESWDAIALLRQWVAEGGLGPVHTKVEDGSWVRTSSAPVPFSRCRALARVELDDDISRSASAAALLRVAPTWGERVAGSHAYAGGSGAATTTALFPAHASGRLGPALHDELLRTMARATSYPHGDPLRGARCAIGHGRVDPVTFLDVGVERYHAGTLDLTHLLASTQALGDDGLLSEIWPLLLPLAGALCAEPRRKPDVGQLLTQLAGWVDEVPDPVLPESISTLAASKGNTKAHGAARALVAGAERKAAP